MFAASWRFLDPRCLLADGPSPASPAVGSSPPRRLAAIARLARWRHLARLVCLARLARLARFCYPNRRPLPPWPCRLVSTVATTRGEWLGFVQLRGLAAARALARVAAPCRCCAGMDVTESPSRASTAPSSAGALRRGRHTALQPHVAGHPCSLNFLPSRPLPPPSPSPAQDAACPLRT